MLTAPDELRQQLRCLTTKALTKRCAGFRDAPQRPIAERCARNTMRSIARRIITLNDEVKLHDRAIRELVGQAAPQLVAEPGIGHVSAAMFVIAWSHPGRCRNEAAFARLGGVAPLPATSGQSQDRHRLNRSGDRQLNSALYVVALSLARHHQPTLDYVERRRAEGRTDREIRRCLKRYIARRVWRLLEHPPSAETTA